MCGFRAFAVCLMVFRGLKVKSRVLGFRALGFRTYFGGLTIWDEGRWDIPK